MNDCGGNGSSDVLSVDQVKTMFTRVARRYDAGNALMTLGLSRWWRGEVLRRARLVPGATVLDLATGTGQLARDVLATEPSARVIGADLTSAMLEVGRRRPGAGGITWACMDAHRLPLPDESVDVVTHGYLLRYLDLPVGLREQYRVLKQGGRIVALETSPGAKTLVGKVAARVTAFWPRLVGRLMGQHVEDYDYLQRSSLAFSSPGEVVVRMRSAGFVECGHRTFLAGMLAVYWGQKPGPATWSGQGRSRAETNSLTPKRSAGAAPRSCPGERRDCRRG